MKLWFCNPGSGCEEVLSSCVRISRSLAQTPFPPKLDSRGKKDVLEEAEKAVNKKNSLLRGKFRFVAMDSLSEPEAGALAERGIVPAPFLAGRKDRVLYVSEDESRCILVNGEEHFLIQTRSAGLSLQKAYEDADRLETILSQSLPFAFDEQLGYLTANPALLGTGMSVFLELHLPALEESGAAARFSANLRPLGISLRGTQGAEPRGSVFRLSNRMTLGIAEPEAIANLCGIAGQIIAQERSERREMARSLAVQDAVGRALGVFRSAKLLDYGEFLELASIVRFGTACGLVKEVTLEQLDSLAMFAQPANLAVREGRPLSPQEESAARTALIRSTLTKT